MAEFVGIKVRNNTTCRKAHRLIIEVVFCNNKRICSCKGFIIHFPIATAKANARSIQEKLLLLKIYNCLRGEAEEARSAEFVEPIEPARM